MEALTLLIRKFKLGCQCWTIQYHFAAYRYRHEIQGIRISRVTAHSRLFIFELPPKRTELALWCDNVCEWGMWAICARNRDNE